MKKLSFALALLLICATAFVFSVSGAEENDPYENAADGDLLYVVDFRGGDTFAPSMTDATAECMTYTPYADGTGIRVQGVAGHDKQECYWGGAVGGLKADAATSYTMYYKVRINGESGKNNSIGVGGLAWITEGTFWRFFNNYGNYNSVFPAGDGTLNRSALQTGDSKLDRERGGGRGRISDLPHRFRRPVEHGEGVLRDRRRLGARAGSGNGRTVRGFQGTVYRGKTGRRLLLHLL